MGHPCGAHHKLQSFELHVDELGYMVFTETSQIANVFQRHHQVMVSGLGERVRDDAHKLVLVQHSVRVVHRPNQVVVQ